MNNYVINALNKILDTYKSIIAFFYQKIPQTYFVSNDLATYSIQYSLLLPSSEYLTFLTNAQVNAQVQAYVSLCDSLITYITSTTSTQTVLFYEQIQNTLNDSITQLNGFSISLLTAQYSTILVYIVPYSMSMTNALYLNNISLDTWQKQVQLNSGIIDFNNLLPNTQLNLFRG